MAKIVLSLEGRIVDQRFLEAGMLNIGSDSESDIKIADTTIAPQCARITTVLYDHFIEATDPSQPVLVNGAPITRALLKNGDIIFFGNYRLKYLNVTSVSPGLDRTQLLSADLLEDILGDDKNASVNGIEVAALNQASKAAQEAKARLSQGRVKGESGQYAGRDLPIKQIAFPVGSRGECLAIINRRPTGCFLTHVSGPLQTKLNGRIVNKEAVKLNHKDVIEAGTDRVVFLAAEQ